MGCWGNQIPGKKPLTSSLQNKTQVLHLGIENVPWDEIWTEVFSKSTAVVSGERLTPLWTLNAAKGDRWRQAGWDRGVGGEESETSFYPQCLLLEHVPKPVYRPSQLDWAWRHWYPRYWCGQTQPPAMFVQRRPSCLLAGRSEWVGELAVTGPELPNRKQWRKWWMKRRFTGWYPNDCRLYAFIWRHSSLFAASSWLRVFIENTRSPYSHLPPRLMT